MTNIFIASDHGGFELKEKVEFHYDVENKDQDAAEVKIIDMGPEQLDPEDDYPQYAFALSERLLDAYASGDKSALGVLICRSGNGMAIAANKVSGIRAALCFSVEHARKAREHDHANVLVLDADYLGDEEHFAIIHAFIHSRPSTDERHRRRVQAITDYENAN
jgi:RpiB/LacA/LacB family sugar-phosphate isomerase